MPAFVAGATSQSDPLLLLDPGIGQGLDEASDREVRRRGAIDDRRNDARRKEGKGGEQTDMPFALRLTLGNLGEGANAAEPDVVDPSPGLGDCDEQSIAAFGPYCRFCAGRTHNALHGREAWRGPGKCDRGRGVAGSQIIEAVVFSS